MNYKVGAVSYGYTRFNQLFNPDNSINSYFPAYYSSDNFKKSKKSDVSVRKNTVELFSGYLGGVLFTVIGLGLFDILHPGGSEPFGGIWIIPPAYTVGSAFGVYFIGSDGEYNKKSMLATLLGSVTAMGAAFLTIYKTDSVEIPLFLGFVLPPIGATIAFNIFDR